IIRLFHGIWFSILTTVTVPIANEFIPANRRGEGMGYFVMSVNLGIVLGPLIGLSFIQQFSYQTVTAILAGIICLGFAFCFLIPVQETVKNQIENHLDTEVETIQRKLSIQDFVEKKAVPVSIMAMIISFSYASIMSFIATFAESKNLLAYASLFFVVFAISMMSLRPITGKIYDRKGPNYVVYPAIALFSLGLIILSQINTVTGLMIAAVFVGMGFGSAQPCLQTLSIQRSPKARIGHATSTFFTCYDIGIALGSILLGVLIAHQGYSFAYLLCAFITALSLVFYKLFVDHPAQAEEHTSELQSRENL